MRRKFIVGEVLDLVVVVEDDPRVACHAEVPPEHVAGEDVRDREVADRVAVLDHRMLELLGCGAVEIDVERNHAALDVTVMDRDRLAVVLDHRRCERVELLEQRGREAFARQREVGELECVGHPPDPVDVLDHRELRSHRRPVGVLAGPEDVLDQLEDVWIRRQREDEHHLTPNAGRLDERVLGVVEVLQEVAIEERLALLPESEHRVQLGARTRRRDVEQELDVTRRHLHVDHEVRARQREEVVDLPRVEHDGVEDEPTRSRRAARGR